MGGGGGGELEGEREMGGGGGGGEVGRDEMELGGMVGKREEGKRDVGSEYDNCSAECAFPGTDLLHVLLPL